MIPLLSVFGPGACRPLRSRFLPGFPSPGSLPRISMLKQEGGEKTIGHLPHQDRKATSASLRTVKRRKHMNAVGSPIDYLARTLTASCLSCCLIPAASITLHDDADRERRKENEK